MAYNIRKEENCMRKNYISANHLQSEVKKILLSDNNYALGTSVHPSSYLFNYQDHLELEFLAYQELFLLNLEVLGEIITYPKTLKTLLSFIKEMKLYNIDIDELPVQTQVDQEIKTCIILLFSLIKDPVRLDENTYVIPTGLTHSDFHYTKNNHIEFKQDSKAETSRYHYAQNKRQELEAIVQEVIQKDLKTVCLVVPNKNDSIPLIESIMKRYGFEGNLENRKILLAKQQFSTFFNFLVDQNQRNFIESLEQNVFNLFLPQDTLSYVKHYNLQFDKTLSNDLCTDERSPLFRIQKRIQNDLSKIESILNETKDLNYQEKYQYVYDSLVKIYQGQMLPYKTYFETYFKFIEAENHALILEHVLSFGPQNNLPEGWIIVDYNNLPLIKQENVYFIGMNAKHFPNISSNTGIIDETYLGQVQNYPSLQERSNYELSNKRRIYEIGKNLVFSYHIATYEGKTVEPSFEIKDYCESHGVKASLWSLKQIRYREKHKAKLNPILAQRLFTKENKIYGSVSSMQKYARDPMMYFMENGLKLREEDDISFNPMIFGNLNHEIVETGNAIDAWNKHVWSKYPVNSVFLKLIEDRNNRTMKRNLEFLKAAEENTKFKPDSFEKKVLTDNVFNNVELLGYVDRIDIADDYFIIVDYKSSETTMSEKSLILGQQLQLLTYAALIQEDTGRKPLGVFFYAFRNPNTLDNELYEYKQSKGVQGLQSIEASDLWVREKRYKGWFFEDPTGYFETPDYWNGLKEFEYGVSTHFKTVYDFTKVKELLQDRYDELYKNIVDGILDIDDLDMELEEKPDLKKEIR